MSSSSQKKDVFNVGFRAQREVQKALTKASDPKVAISDYQRTHSLHSQFARAFGTTPRHEVEERRRQRQQQQQQQPGATTSPVRRGGTGEGGRGYRVETATTSSSPKRNNNTEAEQRQQQSAATTSNNDDDEEEEANVETIDTDSISQFLSHLGWSQYEIHKKIGDMLQKQLEDELRKTTGEEPLLQLLQNCWPYAITHAQFRPILWSVLKALGRRTPVAFLRGIGTRNSSTGQLEHPEIFHSLDNLLKRLVWETDWMDRIPAKIENDRTRTNAKKFQKLIESTLLYETLEPLIESYCTTPALVEASEKFFVHNKNDRRIVTSHRRALHSSSSVIGSSAGTTSRLLTSNSTSTSVANNTNATTDASKDPYEQSAEAVSQIRNLLSDTSGGSASYRPVLLHALMSILMAKHGRQGSTKNINNSNLLLVGERHLTCTLVSDVLLSTSGPLPKEYSNVHRLARVLDEAVTRGYFTDKDLIEVQATLNLILQSEPAVDVGTDGGAKEDTAAAAKAKKDKQAEKKKMQINRSLIRQLNNIVTTAITQMMEEDGNSIFLNQVTDAIAAGYSKVIKKPMSISQMETKIDNNVYEDLESWQSDVKLMFANCMKYNKGEQGAWFRQEAERQKKIFTDEILPQAKKAWAAEVAKRNPQEDQTAKRPLEGNEGPKIEPFEPVQKQRKLEDTSEYSLSMVAVASMLLSDPFVVRILVDRVLKSLRNDVLKGESIPAAHIVIPPISQLLTLAMWSPKMCLVRGDRYFMAQAGLTPPTNAQSLEDLVPYVSLRRYMPVMVHLLLDADLEKRLQAGGEFHAVANVGLDRPEPTHIHIDESTSPQSQVAISVMEGFFIQLCLPGHSQDISLARTFSKCSAVLLGLTGGSILNEVAFFKSLIPAILRHNRPIKPAVRDSIINTWTGWLKDASKVNASDRSSRRTNNDRPDPMTSTAHQYLILLLNEWATKFGNVLLPRDLLLEVATNVAVTVNDMEQNPDQKLAKRWEKESDPSFVPIKAQYERLLELLPESHQQSWKKAVGIESGSTDMEVE